MTAAERLEAIKTFLIDRVEDRRLQVDGDDTDTLFDMIEAAIDADDGMVEIPQLTVDQLAERFGRKP